MKKLLTALLGSAAFIAMPSAHADTWTGAYGGIFGGYGWSNTDVGFLDDAGDLVGLGDPCSSSNIGNFKGISVAADYWEGGPPSSEVYCDYEDNQIILDRAVGALSLPGQTNLGSFDADGEILGVNAGINYQTGNWVFGIEAEGGLLGLSETITAPPSVILGASTAAILPGGTEIVMDGGLYLGAFGKLGYSFGDTLLYGKAGYGAADLGITVNIYNSDWCGPNICWSNTSDDMVEALMYGAGVEHIIANGVSLKLEYLRMEFDETDIIVQNGPEWNYFEFDTSVDTVKLGVNFHLGSGD